MPRFKVGDYVERVGVFTPTYMKFGRVVRVIPHAGQADYFTEYEVGFDLGLTGIFRQTELRLAEDPSVAKS
jgi:hypothetical protein